MNEATSKSLLVYTLCSIRTSLRSSHFLLLAHVVASSSLLQLLALAHLAWPDQSMTVWETPSFKRAPVVNPSERSLQSAGTWEAQRAVN